MTACPRTPRTREKKEKHPEPTEGKQPKSVEYGHPVIRSSRTAILDMASKKLPSLVSPDAERRPRFIPQFKICEMHKYCTYVLVFDVDVHERDGQSSGTWKSKDQAIISVPLKVHQYVLPRPRLTNPPESLRSTAAGHTICTLAGE